MPTKQPRTYLTHTAAVERALAVARKRWPNERDSVLLTRLLALGADALEHSGAEELAAHRTRVRAVAGTFTGLYADNYLEEVREGWGE